MKVLSHNDWGNLDRQPEFGAGATIGTRGLPVELVVEYVQSHVSKPDPDVNATDSGSTSEGSLGIRGRFAVLPNVDTFVGAGFATVSASTRAFEVFAGGPVVPFTMTDSSSGPWVDAGLHGNWPATHMLLEFGVRYSYATVSFGGIEAKAGGFHALLGVGFRFGEHATR